VASHDVVSLVGKQHVLEGPTTPNPTLKGRLGEEGGRAEPRPAFQLRWEATNLFKPNLSSLRHDAMSFIVRDT
jgi:hypothetical protein